MATPTEIGCHSRRNKTRNKRDQNQMAGQLATRVAIQPRDGSTTLRP